MWECRKEMSCSEWKAKHFLLYLLVVPILTWQAACMYTGRLLRHCRYTRMTTPLAARQPDTLIKPVMLTTPWWSDICKYFLNKEVYWKYMKESCSLYPLNWVPFLWESVENTSRKVVPLHSSIFLYIRSLLQVLAGMFSSLFHSTKCLSFIY